MVDLLLSAGASARAQDVEVRNVEESGEGGRGGKP